MAFTGIFCSEAEIDAKTGKNVSASFTQAMKNDMAAQAESYLNLIARVNYSDTYAALNVDLKRILSEAVSCLVAIYGISYDMSGYTSRTEAELMINILITRFDDCIQLLLDQKTVTFIT